MKIIIGDKQMREALALYLEHILNQEHGAVEVNAADYAFGEFTIEFTQKKKE